MNLFGIIPARAGFTRPIARRGFGSSDHPRSRGVYDNRRAQVPVPQGSSPLARGLQPGRGGDPVASGIIPARAGFTRPCPRRTQPTRDHPRSRGVYCHRRSQFLRKWGSSPLARGLPALQSDSPPETRIIPARAGFTVAEGGLGDAQQDHPRSRGVYAEALRARAGDGGSSPLARGLPDGVPTVGEYSGIIPARAGFTTPTLTDRF